MYSINFSATKKRFCLSLHYNGDNSYLFVTGKEIIKFKTKDSEIVEDPICLGNISKDFSERNIMIRYIKWHKTCKCRCKLDANVCNNKQRWSKNKCRCESKELSDKGLCDKGFIWDPSNCECECDKSCEKE